MLRGEKMGASLERCGNGRYVAVCFACGRQSPPERSEVLAKRGAIADGFQDFLYRDMGWQWVCSFCNASSFWLNPPPPVEYCKVEAHPCGS